jgi:hypothetical protein
MMRALDAYGVPSVSDDLQKEAGARFVRVKSSNGSEFLVRLAGNDLRVSWFAMYGPDYEVKELRHVEETEARMIDAIAKSCVADPVGPIVCSYRSRRDVEWKPCP